jgi:hypothetical protein
MKLSLFHEMISFNEVYSYYHHSPFHSRDLDVMLIVSDKISVGERGFMFSDFRFVTIGSRLFKG